MEWGCALMPGRWCCLSDRLSHFLLEEDEHKSSDVTASSVPFSPWLLSISVIKGQTFCKEELSICYNPPVSALLTMKVKL